MTSPPSHTDKPGKAVAATSDRHGKPDPAGEADGIDDVGHASAPDDERRVPVDRPVPHPPMGVVAAIARTNYKLATQGRSQLGNSALVEADALPGGGRHGRHGGSITAGLWSPVRNLGSTHTPG